MLILLFMDRGAYVRLWKKQESPRQFGGGTQWPQSYMWYYLWKHKVCQ